MESTFLLVLLKLLIAHLISDYFLQFRSWVIDKEAKKIRSPKLYAHILVTFIAAGILTGEWLVAAFIGITHFAIDATKMYIGRKDGLSFIIDQVCHFGILLISALWLSRDESQLWHLLQEMFSAVGFWSIAFGYLLVTFPISMVISVLTYQWRKDIFNTADELSEATETGKWVGIAERLLVLTFVLMNQFTVIGLLITAKAVFHVRESNRGYSQYVLIGTLTSVCVAVLVGLLIKFVLVVQL